MIPVSKKTAAKPPKHIEQHEEEEDELDAEAADEQQDDADQDDEEVADKSNASASKSGGANKLARTKGGEAGATPSRGPQVILAGLSREAFDKHYESLSNIRWCEPGQATKRHSESKILSESKTYGSLFKHPAFAPDRDLFTVRHKGTGVVSLATLIRTDAELAADYGKNIGHRVRIPTANLLLTNPHIKKWVAENKAGILDGTKTFLMDLPSLTLTDAIKEKIGKPTAPRAPAGAASSSSSSSSSAAGAKGAPRTSKPKPKAAPAPASTASPMQADGAEEDEDEQVPAILPTPAARTAVRAKPAPRPKAQNGVEAVLAASSSRASGFVAQPVADIKLSSDAIASLPKKGEDASLAQWGAGLGTRLVADPDVWYNNLNLILGKPVDMPEMFAAMTRPDQKVETASKAARAFFSAHNETPEMAFGAAVVFAAQAVSSAVSGMDAVYTERRKREIRRSEHQADAISSLTLEVEALKADNIELQKKIHEMEDAAAAAAVAAASSLSKPKADKAAAASSSSSSASASSRGKKRQADEVETEPEPLAVEEDIDEGDMY